MRFIEYRKQEYPLLWHCRYETRRGLEKYVLTAYKYDTDADWLTREWEFFPESLAVEGMDAFAYALGAGWILADNLGMETDYEADRA